MKAFRVIKSIACLCAGIVVKRGSAMSFEAATLLLLLVGFAQAHHAVAQSVIPGYAISTVAGGGSSPSTCSGSTDAYGDGCAAISATLNSPQRLIFDAAGDMYIADTTNNLIRMISAASGTITTIAGGGASPSSCAGSVDVYGDGCAATQATLSGPQGMAFDGQGNLYIVDRGHLLVRKITNPASGAATITNIAGKPGAAQSNCTASATAASLTTALLSPKEIAFDIAGNLYISENGYGCWGVVEIANTSGSPAVFTPGALSAITGNLTSNSCTVYPGGIAKPSIGTAATAATCSVDGIVADKLGNLYITQSSNYAVAEIVNVASKGTAAAMLLLSGTEGTSGSSGDGGAATSALLHPESSTVDASGNVFIADQSNSRIREIIASSGVIVTIAGGGTVCTGATDTLGDGCSALAATLSSPQGVAFDPSGNLYIADASNNRIRKLVPANYFGLASTAVGASSTATLYLETTAAAVSVSTSSVSSPSGDFAIGTPLSTGTALESTIAVPVTFTPKAVGTRSEPVTFTDNSGASYTFELTGIGNAPLAGFLSPPIASVASATGVLKNASGSAIDTDGNLYIVDAGNNSVRKITPAGAISIVAGTGTSGSTGDGGAATSATLNGPLGVGVDGRGNLYIADTGNNVIREVSGGIISTIAGSKAVSGYAGDFGAATSATLNAPSGVTVDPYGNIFIADTGNNVIRRVSGGTIWTFAGGGTGPTHCAGSSDAAGDGCAPTLATLKAPTQVALDPLHNLYIVDQGNNVVRKLTASTGVVSILAGTLSIPGYGGDGVTASTALLSGPSAVALDAAGDLYITDTGNDVVREVNAAGIISTLTGISGKATYTGDGGSAALATLNAPAGISVSGTGVLYVVDSGNKAVRDLTLTSSVAMVFPDTAINTTSTPLTFEIQNIGTSTLTFTGLTFSPYFAQQATTARNGLNCGTTASSSTATSLVAGAQCYIASAFTPTAIASDSGNITVTDNSGNVLGSTQSVAVSGNGVAAIPVITVSVVTTGGYGNPSQMSLSLAATGSYGTPTGTINYAVDGGTASTATLVSGAYSSSLGNLTAGTHSLTVNYLGNGTYGRATVTYSFVVTGLVVALTATLNPANPSYGATVTVPVTLTASASATPLPGPVYYTLDNSGVQYPLSLGTSGSATIALGNTLAVGSHSLLLNYQGSTQYGTATQTLAFTVGQAATTIVLAGPGTVYTSNPFSFAATVSSSTGALTANSGTVVFQVGSTVLCTVQVGTGGVASCPYTFGAAPFTSFGTYSLNATYQGGTNFITSSTTFTLLYSAADFTLYPQLPATASSGSQNVTAYTLVAGQSVPLQVEVQGNDFSTTSAGYQGTVALSCSNLPSFMSCTFNPTTITISAATYATTFPYSPLTINTFKSVSVLNDPNPQTRNGIVAAGFFLPGLLLTSLMFWRRRSLSSHLRRRLASVAMLLLLAGLAGLSGCGYNVGGTASGTYHINIVGTDSTNNIIRSTPLTITVTQ